jgi:hypothetical protein
MRRFLPLTVLVVIIGGLIAAGWIWGDNDRWERAHGDTHIVQVVDDQGQPVGDGTAVIIERDGRPFFFPFGFLVVPLVIFVLFWAFRAAFWRGPRGPWQPEGPGYAGPGGTPPPWFQEWYQQMERRSGPRADTTPSATPSPPQDRQG